MPQFDLVRLQLAANHLQTLQTLLAQHVPQAQVWAYGSRVTGGAHEGSDLDLVLRNLADLTQPVEGWAALKEALQESSLPMLVEVHLWASLPAAFHRNIEAGYVVVWEAGTSLGMANEWKECSLGDVVELKRGYDLPQRERVPGDVPLVSSSGVTDTHAKAMVKGPGVVTGRYGTLGQVFYVEHDFWPLNTTLYVRDFKGNDPRFISYFLRNIDFLVYSDKAAVPGLNRNHLHQARVRIPSASTEQRAIAHILGTLDDKIELNRRMNETLEATARALFQAWFVDFEPVRAKMDGRWLPGQSLPGLPAHIYDLFPDRLVESDLGEKPHGWEITSLSKFAALNPESWTKTTRPEAIRYVDLSNTKWGRIEAVTHYRADDAPSRAQRVLQALDTIVGTVRPGNGSYALVTEEGLTGSTGFAVLRPLRLECAEFVYLAATASTNIDRLSNLADGGAYPAVSSEVVLASQVPRVGEALINEFSRRANPLFEKVAENERESYSLAQIRDTLLPQLISGELRVADAARILKGVEKHD